MVWIFVIHSFVLLYMWYTCKLNILLFGKIYIESFVFKVIYWQNNGILKILQLSLNPILFIVLYTLLFAFSMFCVPSYLQSKTLYHILKQVEHIFSYFYSYTVEQFTFYTKMIKCLIEIINENSFKWMSRKFVYTTSWTFNCAKVIAVGLPILDCFVQKIVLHSTK